MADFNLTQTDAQVQSILNDAQDAQGAGAQTTLTKDYIMLKGTNGRYHKIQKESFTEAVRNTLASLLVNNDKGTTISQIAAIASGDFGSVTPANLASVLGGSRAINALDSSSTLADFKGNNIISYVSTSKPSDMPSGAPDEYCVVKCEIFSPAFSMYVQELYFFGGALYRRIYWQAGLQGWGPWKKIMLT